MRREIKKKKKIVDLLHWKEYPFTVTLLEVITLYLFAPDNNPIRSLEISKFSVDLLVQTDHLFLRTVYERPEIKI